MTSGQSKVKKKIADRNWPGNSRYFRFSHAGVYHVAARGIVKQYNARSLFCSVLNALPALADWLRRLQLKDDSQQHLVQPASELTIFSSLALSSVYIHSFVMCAACTNQCYRSHRCLGSLRPQPVQLRDQRPYGIAPCHASERTGGRGCLTGIPETV